MPTRLKKTRKLRGYRQMGYGRVGKHRKHPGGRGMAGGLNHMRSWVDRYHPGRYGKVGFNRFAWNKNNEYCPAVNIDRLWSLVGDQIYNEHKERIEKNNSEEKKQVPVIDVCKHGYFKVLGRGKIPKCPMIVRAKFFTKRAEKKIREAGGICELRS